MMLRSILVFAAVANFGTAQLVWTVNPSGGADFDSVEEAVERVDPGDTLLLQPGWYSATTIRRGVQVVAEPGAAMAVLTIVGVPASERVVVAGGQMRSVIVMNCAGSVWIDSVRGRDFYHPLRMSIVGSDSVVLETCAQQFGVHDLTVVDSRVTAFDTSFVGQFASTPDCNPYIQMPCPTAGFTSPGLWSENSLVTAVRCEIRGGHAFAVSRVGGVGAYLARGSTLETRASSVVPGLTFFVPGAQVPNIEFADPGISTWIDDPAPLPGLSMPDVLREGKALSIELEFSNPAATPSIGVLTFGETIGLVEFPPILGTLVSGPTFDVVPVQSATASLTIPGRVSNLAPGVDSATFFVQFVELITSTNELRAGAATTITLLGAAY